MMPIFHHLGHLPHNHRLIGVAVAIGVSLFVAVVVVFSGWKNGDD